MAVEGGARAEGRRGGKSAAAFRTISEVAEELDTPAHVLRFWETRFSQVRPLKRGGGRRYYRPEDVALLRRIRRLLYADGYTIKGVQRLLREGAVGPRAGDGADAVRAAAPETPPAAPAAAPAAAAPAGLDAGARREIASVLDELEAVARRLRAARE